MRPTGLKWKLHKYYLNNPRQILSVCIFETHYHFSMHQSIYSSNTLEGQICWVHVMTSKAHKKKTKNLMVVNYQRHSKTDVNSTEKRNIIAQPSNEVECVFIHIFTPCTTITFSSLDQTWVRTFIQIWWHLAGLAKVTLTCLRLKIQPFWIVFNSIFFII